jgi:hypothetical protein
MRSKKEAIKLSGNLAKDYGLDKLTPSQLRDLYQVVNSRRLQWDNLFWQVPLISISGVSFLFTIIFNSTTSHYSRLTSCFLAIIISSASLSTLARHRLSEVHDSNLLAGIELLKFKVSIHGKDFKNVRNTFNKSYGRKHDFWDFIVRGSNQGRAYPVWIAVFIIFILVSISIVIAEFISPDLFVNSIRYK